jgi:hypothetical protein
MTPTRARTEEISLLTLQEKLAIAEKTSAALGDPLVIESYSNFLAGLGQTKTPQDAFLGISYTVAALMTVVSAVATAKALGLEPRDIQFTPEEIAEQTAAAQQDILDKGLGSLPVFGEFIQSLINE